MGLLLFILYINDMGENLASPLNHFADNTSTHETIPKHEDLAKDSPAPTGRSFGN